MIASGAVAGRFTPDYVYDRTDRDGMRFGDELGRIGYKGDRGNRPGPVAAYLELHVEQGPVLEDAGHPGRGRRGDRRHHLERDHRRGPGRPRRPLADAAAPRRPGRRRAHDRRGGRHRPRRRGRRRHRRPHRRRAERDQHHPRQGHHERRLAPPRPGHARAARRRVWSAWRATSRRRPASRSPSTASGRASRRRSPPRWSPRCRPRPTSWASPPTAAGPAPATTPSTCRTWPPAP